MGTFNLLPVADTRNQGWTVTGAASLWDAWDDDDDGTYASSPSNRGWADVSFPVDTGSLPEGAVISSVTVFLRGKLNIASDQPRATIVSILSADDESRVSTRSIYPTDTITTLEVGTFPRDARGLTWDVHRLNQLRVRVYSAHHNFTDQIRVYKLYVRVNYHVRPTVDLTAPTGQVSTPSPRLTWTYSHTDADAEAYTEYRVFRKFDTTNTAFNVETSTPEVYDEIGAGITTTILPESLAAGDYVIYMRSVTVHGAKSLWVSREFTVMGPHPGIPGGDDNSGPYGAEAIAVVPDSYESVAHLTLRDSSNLLSVQQSDFDTTSDPFEFVGTNCTLSHETVNVFTRGQGSLKLTTSTAGTVTAAGTFVDVSPSTPYTARAQVLSAASARTAGVYIQFYDSSYATVGSELSNTTTSSTTTWKEVVYTGTTPSTAAFAKVSLKVSGTALSEVHYFDRVGLMYGTSSPWSSGGHLSRNLLTSVQATADYFPGSAPAVGWSAYDASTSVARVSSSGTGAHGDNMFRMTYTGITPSIAFRAAGTEYTDDASGTAFTLNKPASAADGDLMVAFVTALGDGNSLSINVPSGWTLVNTVTTGGLNVMYVLKRTFVSGDPASWSGSFTTAVVKRYARVVAYSGAANASEQFVAENVRAGVGTSATQRTATLTNTDSNAWRLSAFCTKDTGAGSFSSVNIQPPTTPPPPQFVSQGGLWGSGFGLTSTYTLLRPANMQAGDVMVAYITIRGSVTASTPTGWTQVFHKTRPLDVAAEGTTRDITFVVLKRTATSSEPSSWSANLSIPTLPVVTGVTAYRNVKPAVDQFLVEDTDFGGGYATNETYSATHTVTSVSSNVIRVNAFSAVTLAGGVSDTSSTEINFREGSWTRSDVYQPGDGGTDLSLHYYDSGNTTLSVGSHQVAYTTQSPFQVGFTFIGLLYGLDSLPAAGADETNRASGNVGSTDPKIHLHVYDSNGVAALGDQTVYGTFNSAVESTTTWFGLIKPASPSPAGYASVKLDDMVDISNVSPRVLELSENKVTVVSHFLGSTSGTPYLSVQFYRANQWITTLTAQGTSFNTSTWTRSGVTFDLPEGTTRMRVLLAASGRSVSDTVSFDRVSLAFGESTAWRNGTGRTEHPIWSHPEIQYSEDSGSGFTEWRSLPGLELNPPEYEPSTGVVTFKDHTIVPLNPRKYRARMVSYGLEGDTYISAWGPESDPSEVTASNWWLKDISDPSRNLLLRVRAEPTSITTKGTAAVFYPMGRSKAVVVGGEYLGDSFELTIVADTDEHAALYSLVESRKTLFLQSDVNHAWWIRPIGDATSAIQVTGQRQVNPTRFITLSYVEVEEEE